MCYIDASHFQGRVARTAAWRPVVAETGPLWAVLRPNGLCWYQPAPAICLRCVTLPSWPWEDSAMHLQSPFCMLAGSHSICACLHYFSSAVSTARFPRLKKLLFRTCRAKHVCLGGVRALCTYCQPSMVGGNVAVVSGPSQAETGELTQLTKGGVVVSMLQGGASLQVGFECWALFPPFTLLWHIVLTLGWWILSIRYEELLASCSTIISGVKRNGKSNKNTWDKQMQ